MDRQTARLILQQGKISSYTQTLNARAKSKSLKYVEYCACAIITIIKWARLNVEYITTGSQHGRASSCNDACYYLRSQQAVSISMKDPLNGDNLDTRKGQISTQTEPKAFES